MKRGRTIIIILRRVRLILYIGLAGLASYWLIGRYRIWLDESETFTIQSITIEGNELLTDQEILQLAGYSDMTRIWKMAPPDVADKIADNAFVEHVSVQHHLPDRLSIQIREKAPIALINVKGSIFCIDREGLVLPSVLRKRYDLPIISGDFKGMVQVGSHARGEAVHQALTFLIEIRRSMPELFGEISEVVVGHQTGLKLFTKTAAIPVWLGKNGFDWKIRCFAAIWKELIIQKQRKMVRYIDLRFRGQVAVGMRT